MSGLSRTEIEKKYREIQSYICAEIERADGKGRFSKDEWVRAEGGGGLTRILEGGSALEKAGVNFSAVHGEVTEMMASSLQMDAKAFFATGVSIVMHPINPHVPIIHMNIRYFEADNGNYWFGGGIDLTPHYVQSADASFFHREVKAVCDRYDSEYYPRFKKWADDYFFIPHRNETRGIGGIFYDHLKEDKTHSKRSLLQFSLDLGKLFPEVYSKLIEKNRNRSFGDREKKWQLLRRGRYVEFNLVYDRGTRFGLLSNGRTESILMSLPSEASWIYDYQPEKDSAEEKTLESLKKGVNWINT